VLYGVALTVRLHVAITFVMIIPDLASFKKMPTILIANEYHSLVTNVWLKCLVLIHGSYIAMYMYLSMCFQQKCWGVGGEGGWEV